MNKQSCQSITIVGCAVNRPLSLAVISFLAFFSLSCRLSVTKISTDIYTSEQSFVSRLLGSTRLLVGAHFIETADRYFHKGVGHRKEKALNEHPFRKLQQAITPETVQHVYGYDMRELVPWLWFAVEINPRNADAYLLAAYILSRHIGRPDIAHQIIQKGIWENPMEYRLLLEDAKVYLREGRTDEAFRRFHAALAFSDRSGVVATEDVKNDQSAILSYLGFLYEMTNDASSAIACYERILQMFPERTVWKKRVDELRAGTTPSVLAKWLWRDTLRKHDDERAACRHGDHEHETGEEHAHEAE